MTRRESRQLWHQVWTAYVFWTLFCSFPALIWFFPLNKLGLSGYETFALALLSPVLLRFQSVRRWAGSETGRLQLRIATVSGLVSFQFRSTTARLCLLAAGTGSAVLQFAADLSSDSARRRRVTRTSYTVGWLAVLASRTCYKSAMPAFSDDYSNWLAVVLTALSVLETSMTWDATSDVDADVAVRRRVGSRRQWLVLGAGLGGVLHIMHALFGDLSTACRWVDGPAPSSVGPSPNPWSLAVMAALMIGVGVGVNVASRPMTSTRRVWWSASIAAAAGFALMYNRFGYVGFCGALTLAVYVGSVWPMCLNALDGLDASDVSASISVAVSVYVLETVYAAWTVAYNFVPFGRYTRETTGYLMTAVLTSIALALRCATSPDDSEVGSCQECVASSSGDRVVARQRETYAGVDVGGKLALIGWLAWVGCWCRYDGWQPATTTSSSPIERLTVTVWTMHFGYDNFGRPNMARSADVLKTLDADVIGLLETDGGRSFTGNLDLAQWLAETLNYYVDSGPNSRRHTWGCALLSRFPILNSSHHLLPSPDGELAPAISATLNVSGVPVAVIVAHFGNHIDRLDRKLQSETVADLAATFDRRRLPVIFLGYLTTSPYDDDYRTLLVRGRLLDVDPDDVYRFCQYIFYNRLHRSAYARLSHNQLSDTEFQSAKFQIPRQNLLRAENFVERRQLTSIDDDDDRSIDFRFPADYGSFRGGHYSGSNHRYHMWTPKYFIPFE